jgi:hypothetical protein
MVSTGMKMRALVPLLCPGRLGEDPDDLKFLPLSRIVEPTAGRPGKIFFSNSLTDDRDPACLVVIFR